MKPYLNKQRGGAQPYNPAQDRAKRKQAKKNQGTMSKPAGGVKKKADAINTKNYDPTAPLTGKNLKRELNSYLRLQTRPLERQLKSESDASYHRQNMEIPTWYQGYQEQLATLRGESQQNAQTSLNRITASTQAGAAQDASNRAGQQERMMADAQMRGVAYDPSSDTGQIEAEAARNNLSTQVLGTLGGQANNQFNYLANRQGIAGQQSVAERMNEASRREKIIEDQRELAGKRGDLANEWMSTQRENERKFYLENKALAGEKADRQQDRWETMFKEKQSNKRNNADNAATAQQNAKKRKADYWKDRRDRFNDNRQNAKDRKKEKGKGGKKL